MAIGIVTIGMSQEAAVVKALGKTELFCKGSMGRQQGPSCSCAADEGPQLIPVSSSALAVVCICFDHPEHFAGQSAGTKDYLSFGELECTISNRLMYLLEVFPDSFFET